MRYVLEGSVRKAGNRVRITGQLIDAATGAHLWADRFDGALEDIFELQDQVASQRRRRHRAEAAPRRNRPRQPQADREPRRLRPLSAGDGADTYKRTEEGIAEAIRLARRGLELDPAFAPAMARIAVLAAHAAATALDPGVGRGGRGGDPYGAAGARRRQG